MKTDGFFVSGDDERKTVRFSSSVTVCRSGGDDERIEIGLSGIGAFERETDVPGAGRVCVSEWRAVFEGLAVTVEVGRVGDAGAVARVVAANTGDRAAHLRRMTPVSIDPASLVLDGAPVREWTYFRQPRQKNDMPAAVRLGDRRVGVFDAVRGANESGGILPGADEYGIPTRFVSSEVMVLASGDVSILLGVLPAHLQLSTCEIEIDEARARVEALDFHCECDGQLLEPSARVESQWVFIDFGHAPLAALDSYSERLASAYHDPNTDRTNRAAPTVWCSWYYYGDGFTRKEAEENIGWLADNRLPFDVFQIDECWDLRWGDWEENPEWTDLPALGRRIRELGYEPGLWSCPFLVEPRARLGYRHPDWLLRDSEGRPITFAMNSMQNHVLDPTHPEVLEHLERLYRRLTHEWGFTYHKLDFTRAVAESGGVFCDPRRNRAEAYRSGLDAIRRGAGPESYLNVCGGLYGPAFGIANAQRTGSDVQSIWPIDPRGPSGEGYGPFTIKQNTLRFWLNRLGHNDPDALMVRRRDRAYRDERLSLGLMNDEEALTSALNQYLGGGIVCFTERLAEIDADRLLLLRHCSPSIGAAAWPLDAVEGNRFPGCFFTRVVPRCGELRSWSTVALVNWTDSPKSFPVRLCELPLVGAPCDGDPAPTLLVTSFRSGTTRRVATLAGFDVGPIPPHSCEVLKVERARTGEPQLLHTDGHFSMGGVEIRSWKPTHGGVELVVEWPWPCVLRLVVGWDIGTDRAVERRVEIPAGSSGYRIEVCR